MILYRNTIYSLAKGNHLHLMEGENPSRLKECHLLNTGWASKVGTSRHIKWGLQRTLHCASIVNSALECLEFGADERYGILAVA
jgi:ATP-dependent phosphoenolpyruvate carboxykinase